jgi:DUF438 domain-containing protein
MIGSLPKEINEAFIETLPIEFSIIDKNDKVIGWNKHETRIFKRPKTVVGRYVQNCHPKKSLEKVEKILTEMKKGKRENATFWIDLKYGENKEKHKVMIQYFTLRNKNREYIGCLEASQDITIIQKLTGKKRLLD